MAEYHVGCGAFGIYVGTSSVLTDSDLSALSEALHRHKEITLVRTYPDRTVTVRTLRGGYPWEAEMLVQVRVHKGRVEWVQTFERLDKAREVLEG